MIHVWRRQIAGILRLEVKKTLFSFRAFPVYVLAALPIGLGVLIVVIGSFVSADERPISDTGEAATTFAAAFALLLQIVIYPSCVLIFMNLIRGEVLDRSLHYYFLSPIRREVLLVGKFIAGWISATLILSITTVISLFLFFSFLGFGKAFSYLLGAGFDQVLGYIGMTALACLGYGAVFVVAGLFLRNPVVPALIFFAWEYLSIFMPPLAKRLTVLYYLEGLRPVPVPQDFFAIVADPISPWLAAPGLLVFATAMVAIASFRIRKMEVVYGND